MEEMQKWIVRIAALIIFVICIVLIVTGQQTIGPSHLLKMLVGLIGLLALLFIYNKKNQ